jgi:POT family proton-dependent oligopeptide transporter
MGHPKGVYFLAFTEAWERFSYYGMTALLVLYMTQQLFMPGHIEHVAGFAGFRAGLEAVFGKMSTLALASQMFGLYTGLVYFTPVFGGLIADRFLGRRRAVVLGATTMCAGHVAMAFDQRSCSHSCCSRSGRACGKAIFRRSARCIRWMTRRGAVAIVIFSTGINIGAVVGPLFCALAQQYGWYAGFGAAAIFMLAGLATYLYGYRYLPARVESAARQNPVCRARLAHDRRAGRVMLISIFQRSRITSSPTCCPSGSRPRRPRGRSLLDPGSLVSVNRLVLQHPHAGAVLALAPAGAARR